ncbi:tRNA (guanine-N(7)-)-methyltransferase subunit TRM82, partial [Phenoliferia sp. Uapishka_3]
MTSAPNSHAHQALISTPTHLVTASHSTLSSFSLSGDLISTSTPHSALIRLLAFHPPNYLISTGEDKKLVVSTLPGLEVVSSRELNKRANGIDVTPEGTILVGDKFGDVFTYPLLVPAPVESESETAAKDSKDSKAEKATPILGHVSMLTAVVFLPESKQAKFEHPAYVVSGDRDEHVRVSRYPKGEVIEKFLWGSKRSVWPSFFPFPQYHTRDNDL